MVAKISVGSSLYGAIAYNGEKINEAQGRLLTTNRIYNDGSGKVDIGKAMEGFHTFLPPQMKVEKPVVHISLNPHPEDVLTDAELYSIVRDTNVASQKVVIRNGMNPIVSFVKHYCGADMPYWVYSVKRLMFF